MKISEKLSDLLLQNRSEMSRCAGRMIQQIQSEIAQVINCGLSSGRITVKASFQFRFRHKKSLLLITVTYVLFVIIRRDVRF